MAPNLDLVNPGRTIHVGVVLLNTETEVLDVAPVDIFNGISKEFVEIMPPEMVTEEIRAQAIDFKFHWVSEAGPGTLSPLTSGLRIEPTDSYENCPSLDIVLYGAHHLHYNPTETELAFARKCYEDSTAFLTICGGVEVPRRAGLLEGKTVTGPRFILDQLRQMSPGVNWVEKRWAQDGKLWTSGALLNGTDMMKNFVDHIWGSSRESLVERAVKIGSWPDREVGYKDVPWAF